MRKLCSHVVLFVNKTSPKRKNMSSTPHIQAYFTSKDDRYSIPESQFSIPVTVSRKELNELLNEIASLGESSEVKHDFDFLIKDRLIRGTLEEHIQQHSVPTEQVITIQCIPRSGPPRPDLELEHKDWVSAVHCSHKYILTGSYDNSIRIWTRKGEVVCVGNFHSAPVKAVRWVSSDEDGGHVFLCGSQDQTVSMCTFMVEENDNVTPPGSAVCLHQCKGHARSVEDLDVCPDKSKFCSVSWDSFLKIWSAVPDTTQIEKSELEPDLPPVKKMKTGIEPRSTTRTPLATFQGHKNTITSVVWAGNTGNGVWSDDDIITAGWDNSIRIWDVATGVNKNTLNGPKAFHSLDLGRDNGLLASGNADRHVRLWDARQSETSMVLSTLSSHSGWVVSINWSPSHTHQLLSGSYDSSLRLWDIRSNKKPLYSILAHEGKVLCSDWSLPQMFASGGSDNKLRTYSL